MLILTAGLNLKDSTTLKFYIIFLYHSIAPKLFPRHHHILSLKKVSRNNLDQPKCWKTDSQVCPQIMNNFRFYIYREGKHTDYFCRGNPKRIWVCANYSQRIRNSSLAVALTRQASITPTECHLFLFHPTKAHRNGNECEWQHWREDLESIPLTEKHVSFTPQYFNYCL